METTNSVVTSDTAWKLKKHGFNWPTKHYYEERDDWYYELACDDTPQDYNQFYEMCSAPTIKDAMLWLKQAQECEVKVTLSPSSRFCAIDINVKGVPFRYESVDERDLSEKYDEAISRALSLIYELNCEPEFLEYVEQRKTTEHNE